MPTEPGTTQTRLQYAAACLTSAADTVTILCKNVESSMLLSISETTKSLLEFIKTIKQNKSDCVLLIEQTTQLLYAISTVYIKSNVGESEISPSILAHIGDFTMTLHKIHTFIEAQQGRSKFKKFFQNAEMSTLLKDCNLELQHAFNVFKIERMDFLSETHRIEAHAVAAHQQVVDLIKSWSSSEGSWTSKSYASSFRSSTSLSLLPSEPKIFHGRESELVHVMKQLMHEMTPRISILGPGGIGKTSLARTVLHHLEAVVKYAEHRFFVACDATSTRKELESLIGSHLGLPSGKDMGRRIIHYLMQKPPSLLILDNLETVWEPAETRKEIEDLLSCFADIKYLALVITMRGAERPNGTRWSHPFLPPLQPLTFEAAQETFLDIADDTYDNNDIKKILHLTDNLPLAINLIAHAVDVEGCSAILHRWEEQRTTTISDGPDKRSNLDISIMLSLSSSRFASVSGAKSLLSLLSILPDGLSQKDLLNGFLPIGNILECKTALLRTSLAYAAPLNHLKVLAPVREYIQRYHLPQVDLVAPLFQKYQDLLGLWKQYAGTIANSEITPQIRLNLANFQSILSFRFSQDPTPEDHMKTLYFGLSLNSFSRRLGHGPIPFMDQIHTALPKPTTDHELEVYFVTEYLWSYRAQRPKRAEALVTQAFAHMPDFVDPQIQYQLYHSAAEYFRQKLKMNLALDSIQKAISLAQLSGANRLKTQALCTMALMQHDLAAYTVALQYAIDAQLIEKQCGDLEREANALCAQAMCWADLSNYQMAISRSEDARSLLFLCGSHGGALDVKIMSILAEVHCRRSEYLQALDMHKQILYDHKEPNPMKQDWGMAGIIIFNVAEIDSVMGVPTQDVQSKIDAARQILNNTGWKRYLPACECVQGELYLRDGNIVLAQELFTKQFKLCFGNYSEDTTYCLERLADIRRWGTAWSLLPAWPVVLLTYAFKTKQKLSLHKALQFLGEVILAGGDSTTASSLFAVALEGFTYMDVHRSRAECMLGLGDIAQMKGNFKRAEELWKAARPLFKHASQGTQVVLVDEKLATICVSEH